MSTIIPRLLPVNGGFTLLPHQLPFAEAATQHATSSSLPVIAVLGGLVVFVVIARMLRSVVSHLLRSAGAAVGVLITLLGTGTIVLTTVVVYVAHH